MQVITVASLVGKDKCIAYKILTDTLNLWRNIIEFKIK